MLNSTRWTTGFGEPASTASTAERSLPVRPISAQLCARLLFRGGRQLVFFMDRMFPSGFPGPLPPVEEISGSMKGHFETKVPG